MSAVRHPLGVGGGWNLRREPLAHVFFETEESASVVRLAQGGALAQCHTGVPLQPLCRRIPLGGGKLVEPVQPVAVGSDGSGRKDAGRCGCLASICVGRCGRCIWRGRGWRAGGGQHRGCGVITQKHGLRVTHRQRHAHHTAPNSRKPTPTDQHPISSAVSFRVVNCLQHDQRWRMVSTTSNIRKSKPPLNLKG
jgi:hypothetical protein